MGTPRGRVLKQYLETLRDDERVSASLLAVAETFYVLCRLKGRGFAEEKLERILGSNVIEVSGSTETALEMGRIKCERAIPFADCACLASAKLVGAKAVFASREAELKREMERKSFPMELVFLEDFLT